MSTGKVLWMRSLDELSNLPRTVLWITRPLDFNERNVFISKVFNLRRNNMDKSPFISKVGWNLKLPKNFIGSRIEFESRKHF